MHEGEKFAEHRREDREEREYRYGDEGYRGEYEVPPGWVAEERAERIEAEEWNDERREENLEAREQQEEWREDRDVRIEEGLEEDREDRWERREEREDDW